MAYHEDENHEWFKIPLNVDYMILGEFGAGAVLITFGVILGKCNLL